MGSSNLGAPTDAADTAPIDLVAQLGGEVASTLSTALERIDTLAGNGPIDGASLRALRDEIEQARRIGIMGQQVSRFASGRVRISSETVDLVGLLAETLRQRDAELRGRGLEIRRHFQPAQVQVDAPLCCSLLQALLDWALEHARGSLSLGVDQPTGPARTRLNCRFDYGPAHRAAETPARPRRLDTMSWRLLEQTAATLGLLVTRSERAGRTTATIEFPGLPMAPLDAAAKSPGPAGEPGGLPRSLVGSQVLVVAARREVRHLVRDALHASGLLVDFVASVDEAREFCRDGLPHAVVHEATLAGRSFDHLRQELLQAAPTLAFVQITEDEPTLDRLPADRRRPASVGRAAIVASLSKALAQELTRRG